MWRIVMWEGDRGRIFRPAASAAFLSALFLSLLCGLFYNVWKYDVERIVREEGSFHGKISGKFGDKELEWIQNFGGVSKTRVGEGTGETTLVELWFYPPGRVYEDLPKLAERLEIGQEKVTFHSSLLSRYLVPDPENPSSVREMAILLLVPLLACISLILIIHHAFAVSMSGKVRQLGILSGIGAIRSQILGWLWLEAGAVCLKPVAAGFGLGMVACWGIMRGLDAYLRGLFPERQPLNFGYHPLVFAFSIGLILVTIAISAWLPARKLSRMTPLEAMRQRTDEKWKGRRKKSGGIFLEQFFGVEGKLAARGSDAEGRAFRTGSISLFVSFFLFAMVMNGAAMSDLSVRMTYFEKYQDSWDVMAQVREAGLEDFQKEEELREISGVTDVCIYQKAQAVTMVKGEEISEALLSAGGMGYATDREAQPVDGGWMVRAPLIILDDESFRSYCEQIGVVGNLRGAVVLNRIQDLSKGNFRSRPLIPYLKGEKDKTVLTEAGSREKSVEIPVAAWTHTPPALREEYGTADHYELVHFLSASLWREIEGQIGGAEENLWIRLLLSERESAETMERVSNEMEQILGDSYEIRVENRIQDQMEHERAMDGLKVLFGGFCGLLGLMGIANVWANAMGFVQSRRRELARYLSIGMTPGQMWKIFSLEVLALAVRPLALGILLSALGTMILLKVGALDFHDFRSVMPAGTIFAFGAVLLAAVVLAYFWGAAKLMKGGVAEALRDDG